MGMGIFFRSVIMMGLLVFLGVNISFAFDLVNMVNPTSLNDNYTNYYFGFSSFVEAFKSYFGDGGGLKGFSDVMRNFASAISEGYEKFVVPLKGLSALMNIKGKYDDLITMFVVLIVFCIATIPVLVMVCYVILYIVFLIAFAFNVVLFVMATLGGAFKTELPNTYDFDGLNTVTVPVIRFYNSALSLVSCYH